MGRRYVNSDRLISAEEGYWAGRDEMQYYSMDLREDKNERVDEDILKADNHAKEDKTSVGRIKLPPQYFHSTHSLHRSSRCPHKLCRGVNLKINTYVHDRT